MDQLDRFHHTEFQLLRLQGQIPNVWLMKLWKHSQKGCHPPQTVRIFVGGVVTLGNLRTLTPGYIIAASGKIEEWKSAYHD